MRRSAVEEISMGWSWRVGRLFGIDIFVHFTFVLLLAFVGLSGYSIGGDAASAVTGIGMVAAVFGIIVLHELGHALAARYYGIPTRDITLLPIGGVARLERMPEKPVQELVVALAGPAVNVVLAGIFGAVAIAQGLLGSGTPGSLGSELVVHLFAINVGLVVFNMLPAFPMDGGRVLRALLAMPLGQVRATEIAGAIGRVMAVLFVLVGIFGIPGFMSGNLMLALVGVFVWIGAGEEVQAVRTRSRLSGLQAGGVMGSDFGVLSPDDRLTGVARAIARSDQQAFPVTVGGRMVGLVWRADIDRALDEYEGDQRVFHVVRRDIPWVRSDEPAERALGMLADGAGAVPVVDRGYLVGMVTPGSVMEYMRRHPAGALSVA
jgi:Zn-dependent protease/predicted transcriptional regulator